MLPCSTPLPSPPLLSPPRSHSSPPVLRSPPHPSHSLTPTPSIPSPSRLGKGRGGELCSGAVKRDGQIHTRVARASKLVSYISSYRLSVCMYVCMYVCMSTNSSFIS